MHCFDRASGEVLWQMDLIERFEAPPVQFGFSSSPMVHDGHVYLLAGGQKGGLICLDPNRGDVLWNVPCQEASYATPVAIEVDGVPQIVFVTRNKIAGVARENGQSLWTYQLPERGLTNVPTPLPTGQRNLVVSGQGVGGTRELILREVEGEWQVDEGWRVSTQFFYCNWIERDGVIFGCNGKLLVAIDAKTGASRGRWRGFADANLVMRNEEILVLDGEGVLSQLQFAGDALAVATRTRVFSQRCWTPPSLRGDQLFCRSGADVCCVDFAADAPGEPLPSLRVRQTALALRGEDRNKSPVGVDALEQIVDAFESGGVAGAERRYMEIRRRDRS
ncbi:MAG: PQQ-binding-like beta-propeller repeat protein, partial [Planctomycetota bacterium]